MEVLSRPLVITLGEDDTAALAGHLADAIRLGWLARGNHPPRFFLDFADEVNRAARRFADVRANAQAGALRELTRVRGEPSAPLSDQPVWLTAEEAARIAEVSVQHMRRCLRRGDLRGSRGGHRSAWRVDASEFAAWLASRRRKEDESKAA